MYNYKLEANTMKSIKKRLNLADCLSCSPSMRADYFSKHRKHRKTQKDTERHRKTQKDTESNNAFTETSTVEKKL